MVRACAVLPGWDYVLDLSYNKKKLEDYAQSFQWLDKRLCELVAEESCTAFFADLPQAAFYYLTEESNDAACPKAKHGYRIRVIVQRDFDPLSRTERFPTFVAKSFARVYILIVSKNWFLALFDVTLISHYNGVMMYVAFGMPSKVDQFERLVRLISVAKRYHDILRRGECIDWRIWCVELTEDEDRNGSEAMDWALRKAYDRLDNASTSLNE
ncbi:hypothetical protein Aperf_G00000055422 [Anoplocephala perfoliata]